MPYYRRLSRAQHEHVTELFEPLFSQIWEVAHKQIADVLPNLLDTDENTRNAYAGMKLLYHDRLLADYQFDIEDSYKCGEVLKDATLDEIISSWQKLLLPTVKAHIRSAYRPDHLLHCLCGDKNLGFFQGTIDAMQTTFAACPDMTPEEVAREQQATAAKLDRIWPKLEPWSRGLASQAMFEAGLGNL